MLLKVSTFFLLATCAPIAMAQRQMFADSIACRIPRVDNGRFTVSGSPVLAGSTIEGGQVAVLACLNGYIVVGGSSIGHCVQQNTFLPSFGTCRLANQSRDGGSQVGSGRSFWDILFGSRNCDGFRCPDSNKCIPNSYLCDQDNDCGDWSDEMDCDDSSSYNPGDSGDSATRCESNQFTCSNGNCIRASYVCDGDNDCLDYSDEESCNGDDSEERTTTTPSWRRGRTTQPPTCRSNQFRCANGNCIPSSYICDRDNDCGDRSDEINCQFTTTQASVCLGFQCADRSECIRQSWVCDGDRDCDDGSDEANCRANPTIRPTTLPTTTRRSSGGITAAPPVQNDASCGVNSVRRIFGGTLAVSGEYPWLAKLYIRYVGSSSTFGCGGALIANQWILTAAHCVTDEENGAQVDNVRALLGRYDLSDSSEQGLDVRSSAVYRHPNYNPDSNWAYDFALIKLSSPVTYRSRVGPICLPDSLCSAGSVSNSATNIDSCTRVSVAGWGRTETENNPDIMRVAEMDISAQTACARSYSGTISAQYQLCVGDGSPSTCRGDSGGPLMCKSGGVTNVIGVVSWGAARCGTNGAPSVFARVCSVLPWIRSTMRN